MCFANEGKLNPLTVNFWTVKIKKDGKYSLKEVSVKKSVKKLVLVLQANCSELLPPCWVCLEGSIGIFPFETSWDVKTKLQKKVKVCHF